MPSVEQRALSDEPDSAEILRLYNRIDDPAVRQRALNLLRELCPPQVQPSEIAGAVRKPSGAPIDPTILLVDDDSDLLVSVGGFLEAARMNAIRASTGTEALNILGNDSTINAVVTDLAMPGMSGVAFVLEARRLRPKIPTLVITGYAHFPRVEELPSDVTVLMKPFRRKEFIFRVEELLNRKRKRADGQ